jgi:hypothetical protein
MKHREAATGPVHPAWWAIIAVVVVYLAATAFGAPVVRGHAERYARDHARRVWHWQAPLARCVGVDGDGNGFVGCTVSQGEDDPSPRALECRANLLLQTLTECRERPR